MNAAKRIDEVVFFFFFFFFAHGSQRTWSGCTSGRNRLNWSCGIRRDHTWRSCCVQIRASLAKELDPQVTLWLRLASHDVNSVANHDVETKHGRLNGIDGDYFQQIDFSFRHRCRLTVKVRQFRSVLAEPTPFPRKIDQCFCDAFFAALQEPSFQVACSIEKRWYLFMFLFRYIFLHET